MNLNNIPSKLKVANNEITVVIEDSLPNNNYGYFCDVTNEIKLARTIKTEYNGVVSLTENQILNSFWHELKVWAPYIVMYM